jgi:hypothetical protein
MSEKRITIIAETAEEAAVEFHRRRLSEKGFRMEGPIIQSRFELVEEMTSETLFDDKEMFVVTFVKES